MTIVCSSGIVSSSKLFRNWCVQRGQHSREPCYCLELSRIPEAIGLAWLGEKVGCRVAEIRSEYSQLFGKVLLRKQPQSARKPQPELPELPESKPQAEHRKLHAQGIIRSLVSFVCGLPKQPC